jgi:hypothetical protein
LKKKIAPQYTLLLVHTMFSWDKEKYYFRLPELVVSLLVPVGEPVALLVWFVLPCPVVPVRVGILSVPAPCTPAVSVVVRTSELVALDCVFIAPVSDAVLPEPVLAPPPELSPQDASAASMKALNINFFINLFLI